MLATLPVVSPEVIFTDAPRAPYLLSARLRGERMELFISNAWWRGASIPERRTAVLGVLRHQPGPHLGGWCDVSGDAARLEEFAALLGVIPTEWWEGLIRN